MYLQNCQICGQITCQYNLCIRHKNINCIWNYGIISLTVVIHHKCTFTLCNLELVAHVYKSHLLLLALIRYKTWFIYKTHCIFESFTYQTEQFLLKQLYWYMYILSNNLNHTISFHFFKWFGRFFQPYRPSQATFFLNFSLFANFTMTFLIK